MEIYFIRIKIHKSNKLLIQNMFNNKIANKQIGLQINKKEIQDKTTSHLDNQFQLQSSFLPYFKSIRTFILIFYSVMSFFKAPIGDSQHLVTATIGTLILQKYLILQCIIMTLLIILMYFELQNLKINDKIICFLLYLIVIIFNFVYYWNRSYIATGLIIRPLFLIFYTEIGKKTMFKFMRIISKCAHYIGLMWFLLFLFACLGQQLYGNIKFQDGTYNFFENLWDSMYQILVLQTTANYPDISLSYYRVSKVNALFFIAILIINTMIIVNMIIATNYNEYKTILQEQYDGQSIFQLIYLITLKKIDKQREKSMIQSLNHRQKMILSYLQSKYYISILWIYCFVMFFVICIQIKQESYYWESIFLFVLNTIIFIDRCIKFQIYKFDFWKYYLFEIYELITSFGCILLFFITINQLISYKSFLLTIILQVPRILRFFQGYLMDFTDSINNFFGKFLEVSLMLYLICLAFAGVGEIWFGGINILDNQNLLMNNGIDPDYVYLNFNNSLNSFLTLFSLLIVNNWNVITNTYTLLMGNTLPRLFFIFFYTFGVLLAYNLILASIIEYIIAETDRFKSVKNYNNSNKQYLLYKKNMQKILNSLVYGLKKIYRKTHKQMHFIRMPEQFTEYFPEAIIQTSIAGGSNAYSIVYFRNLQIEQYTFEAATMYNRKSLKQSKIFCLNKIINKSMNLIEIWKKISVKSLLEQQGLFCNEKNQFQTVINKQITQLRLNYTFSFNKIKVLVQYYLIHKVKDSIYYVIYDLPQGFCCNITDLYINNKLMATSFKYKIENKIKKNKLIVWKEGPIGGAYYHILNNKMVIIRD